MSETITIQFRVPKEYVNEFNEYVKQHQYATHNQVVKAVLVSWLNSKRTKAAPEPAKTVQATPKQESSLEELVDNWS